MMLKNGYEDLLVVNTKQGSFIIKESVHHFEHRGIGRMLESDNSR